MVNLSSFNPFGASVKASSEIVELRVYPIKSCRGISITESTLGASGLEFDRRWMFVDTSKDNEFQTIRQISELTLFDTAFVSAASTKKNSTEENDNEASDDEESNADESDYYESDSDESEIEDDLDLVVSISGQPEKRIQIPARPTQEWLEENTKLVEVGIWGSRFDGWLYNDKYSKIFTDFLGKPVGLVYKGPKPRLAAANGAPHHLGREQPINYPDVMPALVVNTASLHELNGRLKAKGVGEITIERFRPNIILRGGEADNMAAWTEDDWKTLRLINGEYQSGILFSGPSSTLDMDVGMRCARCQVPNVNPETAEKHKKEPWDTLVSYRRVDEGFKFKPCFGMLVAPRTSGPIRVGMTMQVIETTKNHKITLT